MAKSNESRERHAKKYYEKNKERIDEQRRKWRKERYKPTEKTKQRERDYFQQMKKIAIELGNCSICFKENTTPKFKTCAKCRKYEREV